MPSAPYGSWRSPITADLIASSSIGVAQPAIDGDDVYWIESRPTEGGRSVIVRRTPDGATHDVNPAPLNARTRVHEYGGGDYLVHDRTVYFANFADQRLYVARPGEQPIPLTHAGAQPPEPTEPPNGAPPADQRSSPSPSTGRAPAGAVSPHRYADFDLDTARNRLICVREDHSTGAEPVNTIAAIDLATGAEAVLAQGHDFFAYPRLSAEADQLAWIAWDHPNMPWDGTRLYVARLQPDGSLGDPLEIAGGPTDSVVQPAWSPDGRLAFVSDLTGWWNLYLWSAGAIEPLVTDWTATRIPPPQTSPSPRKDRGPGGDVPMPGGPSSMPRSTAADPSMPRGSARGTGANTPAAEFAKPLWQLGASSYAFVDATTIICTYCVRGSWRLARLDVSTGALTDLDTPYTDIGALHAAAGRALFIAGSPSQRAALISLDLTTIPAPAPSHAEAKPAPEPDASMPGDSTPTTAAKTPMPDTAEQTSPATRMMPGGSAPGAASISAALSLTTLKSTSDTTIDPRYLSTPEALEYPTTLDGAPTTAFAFYYPPHNADYDNPASAHPEALEGRAVPNPSTQLSPSPRKERGPGGVVPPSAELPPLLVISHGGPTAATSAVLSPRIQYWTSRGIAVLDVNYGGSTGFGTEYRRRLNRRWGIVDVDDCINAARYLVDRRDVDPARLAITGGSAGGYTTLCALTMRDLFSAGASYYGVAELEALARDTHKFESRYLDGLIGPYPAPDPAAAPESPASESGPRPAHPEALEGRAVSNPTEPTQAGTAGLPLNPEPQAGAVGAQPTRGESEGSPLSSQFTGVGGGAAQRDAQRGEGPGASGGLTAAAREALLAPYRDRSPINHVDGISCPVIFFQGLEDQIVPPNQAEMMVEALRRKGIPVEHITFEHEQHGFRRAENIKRSLEAELAFYGRIFSFLPR